jgi:hypothetical protein
MSSPRRFRGGRGSGVAAALGSACVVAAAAFWFTGAGVDADAVPIPPPAAQLSGPLVAPAAPAAPAAPDAVAAPDAEDAGRATAFSVPSPTVTGAPPVELRLPGRTVPLDPVGVAPDGSVDVPDDPSRAGWWAAGSAPTDPSGTTVLVGHLDSATQGIGAFAALLDLPANTSLSVVDSTGSVHRYRVTTREQLVKTALPASVFARDGGPRLVLITCGGTFDRATHHYEDNVVVTAVPDGG